MIIIKTDESAHRLKPEFIKRVAAESWVRTRRGYEYERHDIGWVGNVYCSDIIRREPLTNAEKIICRVEWR